MWNDLQNSVRRTLRSWTSDPSASVWSNSVLERSERHSGSSPGPVDEVRKGLNRLDLVATMDCTGSMGGWIREARDRIGELFQKVSALTPLRPDLAVGVFGYRDHPPQDLRPIPYRVPLSTDVSAVRAGLRRFKALGGGDGPEAVWDGLNAAFTQSGWRPYSYRVAVLVGDAPPHGEGAYGDGFPRGCPCGLDLNRIALTAREQGVLAVHCAGAGGCHDMERSFRAIAARLNGIYVPLSEMDSLIARIEALMVKAVAEMTTDATVFELAHRDPAMPARTIAERLGRDATEVEASLTRLRARKTLVG